MKLILFLFVILGIFPVFAAETTNKVFMSPGEHFLFDGKNITLVDSAKDSVVVCINNKKAIISEERTIDSVKIRLIESNERDAELKFTFDCKEIDDCVCDDIECLNNLCLPKEPTTTTQASTTTTIETTTLDIFTIPDITSTTLASTTTLIQETQTNSKLQLVNLQTSTLFLFVIAIVLLFVVIIKKTFET